jgi:hypothetical protein
MAVQRTAAMAKAARRYDIFLPLADNNGNVFPDRLFESVERRLLKQFGGVTSQQRDFPLRGIWQGETHLFFDQVIVMTVLDFRRSGSVDFISSLKRFLISEFDQLAILITESSLRVH